MPTSTSTRNTAARIQAVADDAEHTAVATSERLTENAANRVADAIHALHDTATPVVQRLATQAEDMARRSIDAVRASSMQLRSQADKVSTQTVGYIREEPVKAVLLAAAAGALLLTLATLLTRSSDHRGRR